MTRRKQPTTLQRYRKAVAAAAGLTLTGAGGWAVTALGDSKVTGTEWAGLAVVLGGILTGTGVVARVRNATTDTPATD